VVPTFSKSPSERHFSPELRKIIDAWSDLPPIVKAGILAMVNAAVSG
jgi:hypothetical protein